MWQFGKVGKGIYLARDRVQNLALPPAGSVSLAWCFASPHLSVPSPAKWEASFCLLQRVLCKSVMSLERTLCLTQGHWMNGSGWFIYKSAISSAWGHRLATVLAHCDMTSLCPAVLFSFKDTTRPRKSHEKEGVEYHFVSKQAFEADLHHNK